MMSKEKEECEQTVENTEHFHTGLITNNMQLCFIMALQCS